MSVDQPIHLKYKIVFEGKDADRHQLEAYPAAQSLEGFSWALALALHYGVTGNTRGRGDLSKSAKIYISPPLRGSVLYELNVFVQNNPFIVATAGAWAVNTVTPYVNGLISNVFRSACGHLSEFPKGAKRMLKRLDGEDIDKLVQKIEPPLTRAHTAIDRTADTILFKSKRTSLVCLDLESKNFLEARVSDTFDILNTNVTSYNILTRNGRLYEPENGETAAFSVVQSPRDGTRSMITKSMEQYASGRRGIVRLTAQRVETVEGRLKKYLVSAAEEVPREDWLDGIDPLRAARDK